MSRKPFETHYWTKVRSHVWCWSDGHDVPAGSWVRFRKGDHARRASCEACLAKKGIYRPARPFTFAGDESIDVRARRAGGDE